MESLISEPTSMSGLHRHPASHCLIVAIRVFIPQAWEAYLTCNGRPVISNIVMASSEPRLNVSTILNERILASNHLSVNARPDTSSRVSSCLRLSSNIMAAKNHIFSQSRYLSTT
jgi:hypothetical protein